MEAASPVIVDLYRLAYNAGRPVTFDQLLDGLPSAYQNDANRWWVAKQKADGFPVAENQEWKAEELRAVKAEWLRGLVKDMCDTRRFSIAHADGTPTKRGERRPPDGVYSAIKERPRGARQGGPPMVEEEVLVKRMVPWTPEIGASGRRHMKGVQFRDQWAHIKALGAKATKRDLELALELAAEALSYMPRRQSDGDS